MTVENKVTRQWIFLLLAVVITALLIRLIGYNFSLPYVDHADEPSYLIAAQLVEDEGSAKSLGMHGYPPGIIGLNLLLLKAFHNDGTPTTTILWMVRILSILFSVGTLIVIFYIVSLIAHPLGGLIASILWASSPFVITHSQYGTPDAFVTFFTLLAIYCVLIGTYKDRYSWTVFGIISIILASIFKYQALFVLPIILIFPLLRLWSHATAQRRNVLQQFAINSVRVGVFLFWLILLYPALEAGQSPNFDAAPDRFDLLNVELVLQNIQTILEVTQLQVPILLGMFGFLVLLLPQWRKTIHWSGVGLIIIAIIAELIGISFFGLARSRQLLAVGALICILSAIGYCGYWFAAQSFLTQRSTLKRAIPIILVGIIGLLLIPNWQVLAQDAQVRTLPDRRNDLAEYMDTSLEPAPHIATWENHKTLNPDWGGYTGTNGFPFAQQASLLDKPIEDWRADGVVYAIEPYENYIQLSEELLGKVTPLKIYPSVPGYRGPSMTVIRLFPIQTDLDASVGSIRFIGYDLSTNSVQTGEMITIRYYWQATSPTATPHRVFNHLTRNQETEVLAQADNIPLFDERRATNTWNDPDETIISRVFEIPIPADLSPGTYTLSVGFYDPNTGVRLQNSDQADRVFVTEIEVTN